MTDISAIADTRALSSESFSGRQNEAANTASLGANTASLGANTASLGANTASLGANTASLSASTASLSNDGFHLINIFEHFFGELARLRRVLESREARATVAAPSKTAGAKPDRSIEHDLPSVPIAKGGEPRAVVISACLTSLLQHYATHMSRHFGSFGVALFEEAQLVMAALADDLFIHEVVWSGRADWQRNPIEAQLFGTSNSGNTVFNRIDDLLAKRDPGKVELACINLYALRLNFRGRYRGTGQQNVLDDYRQRLHGFIANRRPRLAEPDYRLFAEAYESTSDLPDGASLPHVKRWILAIAIVLVSYLVISHLIWSYNIATVLQIIDLNT